ncbi:MAG TPA: ABC transporter ATP-binding protein [Desulfatiglandales bacterium]|nr:ABC transporter ATP-binding protein [Desulfatiglandales bacterium]
MLEVNNIDAFYGRVQALWGVSLRIDKGEIVALVGSNGAGKTTLLNTIFGLLRPASGTVEFLGRRIDGLAPHKIGELGISYIPEGGKLFTEMTVRENLEMGAYVYEAWKRKEETVNQVYEVFPILKGRQGQLARTLSGGEHQMLAIGRGLMSRPRLCIFDEPSYGLAPLLVTEIFRIIQGLHDQGIAILVIEQNVRQTLEIADRAYLLENGRIVLEGDRELFLYNDYVKKAYLGL